MLVSIYFFLAFNLKIMYKNFNVVITVYFLEIRIVNSVWKIKIKEFFMLIMSKIFTRKILFLLVTVLLILPNIGFAQNKISLGVSGMWITSPYKEHNDLIIPFPMIEWEAKHFYIRGYSAGLFLWTDDNEMNELSLGLAPGWISFNDGSTDDKQLSRLDDRKRAIDAYLQYIIRTEYGTVGVKLSHDVLGNAKGFMADASYSYTFNLGNFDISPGAGLKWESQERLDYYYGISHDEARKSGLKYYEPDSGFTPFLSLDAKYQLNERISLFADTQLQFLSNEIEDSPMVDRTNIIFANIGASYSF